MKKLVGVSLVGVMLFGFVSPLSIIDTQAMVAPSHEISEGAGNVYTNKISVTFNVGTEHESYETPTKIELYLDGNLVGSATPEKVTVAGSPELVVEISNDCSSLPQPELVVWNDVLNMKAYGYEGAKVEYKVYYADGTVYNQDSNEELIFVGSAGLASDETLLNNICSHFGEDVPTIKKLSDISGTTFETYIQNIYDDGVISGYSDGTYRPNEPVTRAQLAKFVVNAFTLGNDVSGVSFPDLDESSSLTSYIKVLKKKGIINGYSDGTYRPNEPVSRGAATKFIVKAMQSIGYEIGLQSTMDNIPFSDVKEDDTFAQYIGDLSNSGIINGYSDGTFKADVILTRGAMAKIVDLAR